MSLANLRHLVAYRFHRYESARIQFANTYSLVTLLLISILGVSNGAQAQEASDLSVAQNSVGEAYAQARIIGGNVSEPGGWPSLVALVIPGDAALRARQFCGGSVVAQRWVLTAAHCMFNQDGSPTTTEQIRIVAGINDLNDTSAVETVVTNIFVHPDYANIDIPVNDIALLELATSVAVPANLLSDVDPETLVGRAAFIAGWGALTEEGPVTAERFPNLLQDASVPVISREQCNLPESYDGSVMPTHMCAGFRQGGVDSCQGDSGGPLYVVEDDEQIQIGVTSFGAGCARPNFYGVYTNVDAYRTWMSNYFNLTGGAISASGAVTVGGGNFAGSMHPLLLTVLAGFTIFLIIRASASRNRRRVLLLAAALLSSCSSNLPVPTEVNGDAVGNKETASLENKVTVKDSDKETGALPPKLRLTSDSGQVGLNQLLLGSTRSQAIEALKSSGFVAPVCTAEKTAIKGTGRLFLREYCDVQTLEDMTLEGLDVEYLMYELLDNRVIKLEVSFQSGDAMSLANQLNFEYDHVASTERPFEWRLSDNHIRIVAADTAADGISSMSLQMIDGRLIDKLPKLFEYPQ